MGRRQQQAASPSAAAGPTAAGGEGAAVGKARAGSKKAVGKDAAASGAMALGVDASVGTAPSSSVPYEATEKAFWELVFTRHDRLHPLLEEVRLSSGARARQLARIHCAQLFNDLVFVGLSHQNVVGFHRSPFFAAFLEELERHLGAAQGDRAAAVEAFVRDYRSDFARFLRVPSRTAADAEYLLLGDNGVERPVDLHAGVCGDCYASHLTGGLPVQVPGLKYDSDVQELYMRLTELLPQAKPSDVVLRIHFRDRDDAMADVIVGGLWIQDEARYEWTCLPMTQETYVDPVLFDPAERLCQPQLAEMGMFLPTSEVVICTRGCLHSYAVGPPGGAAAAMMAPMAQDLLSHGLNADETALLSAALGGGAMAAAAAASSMATVGAGGYHHAASVAAQAAPGVGKVGNAKRNSIGGGSGGSSSGSKASKKSKSSPAAAAHATASLPYADLDADGAGGGGRGKGKPTKRYTCCFPGCVQSATFKPADEPRSKDNMVCVRHACKGMSCIKGPLCDHPDCVHEGISSVPRRATFGFPGERQRRCGKHKLDGMLYATELVKEREKTGPPPKLPRASAASYRKSSLSGSYGDDDDDDDYEEAASAGRKSGSGGASGSKRKRAPGAGAAGGSSAIAAAAAALAAVPTLPSPHTSQAHQEELAAATASAFSSNLEAALARGIGGMGASAGLSLTEADEEREQQQQQQQQHASASLALHSLAQHQPQHQQQGGLASSQFEHLFGPAQDHDAALRQQLQLHQQQQHQQQQQHLFGHQGATTTAAAAAAAASSLHQILGIDDATAAAGSMQALHHAAAAHQNPYGGGYGSMYNYSSHQQQLQQQQLPATSLASMAAAASQPPLLDLHNTTFADLASNAALMAMLQERPEALTNLITSSAAGGSNNPYFQMQPSPATTAAAAALAASLGQQQQQGQPSHQGGFSGQQGPSVFMMPQDQPPQQPSQPQQQQRPGSHPNGLEQGGATTADEGNTSEEGDIASQPMRFDLLIEAASANKDSNNGGDKTKTTNAAAFPGSADPLGVTGAGHPGADEVSAAWAELASPSTGLLVVDDGDDPGRMFARLGPSSSTPGGSSAVAPPPPAVVEDVDDEEEAAAAASSSVWASDITAVVVCRTGAGAGAGAGAGVRGFEPEDEGVYYVKSVARWCPVALAEGRKTKAGVLRELVRNPDHLGPVPGSNEGEGQEQQPQRQLSTVAALDPAAVKDGTVGLGGLVLLDEASKPLGLGKDCYVMEEANGPHAAAGGRSRRGQRLVLGWSPSGLLEVDFDHRPCGVTISELEAAMVLRPLGPTGPWLETFITDFARQGLALCAGDLAALLQGAVRQRRGAAVAGGEREAEALYDPEECLAQEKDLPLDVLDGPLSALASDPRSALKVASYFLVSRTDAEGRARFPLAAFTLFFNCFGRSRDPFATALAVWSDLATVAGVDFWRFQAGAHEFVAPMSPTRVAQKCFLRLSDLEPGRLVLDWYRDDAFGLSHWAATGGSRPKGVLLRWEEDAGAGPSGLAWAVDNPALQALLVEQAHGMGLDARSLAGLVAAAQQVTGAEATGFLDTLMAEGRRQQHRRFIGAC